MNSDVKGSRISDLMFDEEEIFEHTLITPITHYFEFSVNFPLIKIEHVTFNNKSKFHQLLGCQIHELKKEYISEKTSRKGGQNVKYVIFKSKNPFENQIFGRTIGRTGPKKEYMYSKRRTSGNPILTDEILKKKFLQKSLLPCEKHIRLKLYQNNVKFIINQIFD
jgi:hypothetical protein